MATTAQKIDKIYDIVVRLEPMVEEHHTTLYGNGQPGLKEDVALISQRQDDCPARNAEKTENKKASKRLTVAVIAVVMVGIASIASLAISIIGLLKG